MSKPLDTLLSHPAIWRASSAHLAYACRQQGAQCIPTGHAILDRELPDGGWPQASLMELLLPQTGLGEMPLLSPVLARLTQEARWVALIAPPWVPYVPTLLRLAIRPEYVMVITPASGPDNLWVMEQCMSSGVCGAVFGWPEMLKSQQIKRLLLASQQGSCLGILFRDSRHAQESSPAPLRLELGNYHLLNSGLTQLQIRILKRPGRWQSDWILLQSSTPLISRRWAAFANPASSPLQPPAEWIAPSTFPVPAMHEGTN